MIPIISYRVIPNPTMTTETKLVDTLTLLAEQKDSRKATLIVRPGCWGALLNRYLSDLYAKNYGNGKSTINKNGCLLTMVIQKSAARYVCRHDSKITVIFYAGIVDDIAIAVDCAIGDNDVKCELVLPEPRGIFWSLGTHHQIDDCLAALKAS